MLSGITALCNLAGGPVAASEAAALGLKASGASFVGLALDSTGNGAAQEFREGNRVTLFTGHAEALADHREALAGLSAKPLARQVRELLDCHGQLLPHMLAGEWTLLDWQPGLLRIVQSLGRHDWLFLTSNQDRIAIAPDLARLSALDWVGRELDPLGFAGALGRGALREAVRGRSVLAGVERLEPGEMITLQPGIMRRSACGFPPAVAWNGTFSDAVAAASARLTLIAAERMARPGQKAIMLSGGLDSSVLAAVLRAAAPAGERLLSVTSVAPDGSGLADERAYAGEVARYLGIEQVLVVPGDDVSVYRPDPAAYLVAGGPSLSSRHYLLRALADAARAGGATTLFDGGYGELTLTSYMPLATWPWQFRQALKAVLRPAPRVAAAPLHVRLAPHRQVALHGELSAALMRAQPDIIMRRRGQAWGYFPGADKAQALPTLRYGSTRVDLPYRDLRLLRLFAGFPADYLVHGGLDRAPARFMAAGMLPDSIRLRRTFAPGSPDYMVRIQREAPAALARLVLFRRAGCDDWFDLDWLETALGAIARNGAGSVAEAFEAQLTAMAAEYLVWWRRAE